MMTASDETINRYSTGKSYLEAAKMIFTSPHYEGSRIIMAVFPMHMLVGFSVELFLKAWLLGAGVDSGTVRGFGHKISDLYTEAQMQGLPTIHSLDKVVSLIAGPHADFTYRYADSGVTVHTANWPMVFPILDDLDIAVDTFIGASAEKGLLPGH